MEAAVASSVSGLRCSLSPIPKQQRRSARVGFMTRQRPYAVTCKRLPHPNPRFYAAAAAAKASDAGSGGIRRKRLAVFVSGGGSNFRSIHDAALGRGGAEHARSNGIPLVVFPKSAPEGVSTAELLNVLRRTLCNMFFTNFIRKLAFGGKGYHGLRVHKAVIASGARYSGPTVHLVDEHYDTGRTLTQRVVPVLANDTLEQLAARVLNEEHKVYVQAVAALCEDRIVWREDGVPLIRTLEASQTPMSIPNS